MPTETAGLLGDPTNHTLTGITMPAMILIITEDSINTITNVDYTTALVVVAAGIILTLLMEVSSIIQPLTDKA